MPAGKQVHHRHVLHCSNLKFIILSLIAERFRMFCFNVIALVLLCKLLNTEAASRMHCHRWAQCVVAASDVHRLVPQFFFCSLASQESVQEEGIFVTLITVLLLLMSTSKHLNEDIDFSAVGASLERIK